MWLIKYFETLDLWWSKVLLHYVCVLFIFLRRKYLMCDKVERGILMFKFKNKNGDNGAVKF